MEILDTKDLPFEIVEAASRLSTYASEQGWQDWKLGAVASMDYVERLEAENRKLAETDSLDKLCVRMLAIGAFAEGTGEMKASEIKALLVPFFGEERVMRGVRFICGEKTDE